MKRTVAWPPRYENGGLAMTADPGDPDAPDPGESLRQICRLRMLPGGSSNAFAPQRLGVDDLTYQAIGASRLSKHRSQVVARFKELERAKRARLVSLTYSNSEDAGFAATRVAVIYEDLERGRREELEALIR